MTFVKVRTAIVVLGNHNPSILHWSFLSDYDIVPYSEFDLVEHVSTPAFSSVKYADGISFLVESNKLQIMREFISNESELPAINLYIRKYLEILPHVKCTSVGHNFTLFWQNDAPDNYIMQKFLNTGPWNVEDLSLNGIGLTLRYTYNESIKQRITLNGGTHKIDKESVCGIIIDANYHADIPDPTDVKRKEKREARLIKTIEAIDCYQEFFDHLNGFVERILT